MLYTEIISDRAMLLLEGLDERLLMRRVDEMIVARANDVGAGRILVACHVCDERVIRSRLPGWQVEPLAPPA